MDDLGIIDEFVKTFSGYIDSGFGLIGGDAYWPVYDCLEGELKRVRSRRRKLGRRFLHHMPSKK